MWFQVTTYPKRFKYSCFVIQEVPYQLPWEFSWYTQHLVVSVLFREGRGKGKVFFKAVCKIHS